MKRLEDRRKIDEDRRRRIEAIRRRQSERTHPSTQGERRPAPVIPIRPDRKEGDDGAAS